MKVKALCSLIMLIVLFIIGCSDTTSPKIELPSNLHLTLVEENTIKLTWQDNSSDETKFFIDRKKGEFEWFENYGEVEANITVFTDLISTNVDTVYSYRVRAFNGDDYTEYSIPTGWFAPITTPTNFEVEEIEENNIKLTWEDNSIGELSFNIDRKFGGHEWEINYLQKPENTTYCYNYIEEPYDTLFYRISAASGNATSLNIERRLISSYFTPRDFNEERISLNQIRLTWIDSCSYEDGFKIDRKIGNNEWEDAIVTLGSNVEEYIDTVENFGTYFYRLYAYKGNVNSFKKSEISESIQYHIDIAYSGDVIILPDGIYYETIIINGKDITIESENGVENCILDGSCPFVGDVGIYISGENNSSVISGLTIRNYKQHGICCATNTSPTISNNIINNNGGGNVSPQSGIYITGCYYIPSSPIISNNLIINNFQFGICEFSSSLIINNTITKTDGSGIGRNGWSNTNTLNPTIINNIIYDNTDYSIYYYHDTDISVTYCNLTDGIVGIDSLGVGCINSDPLFVDPLNGDYNLQPGSPCINTGNPDPQYNDPDGTRNDMGAYGGHEGNW